MTYKILHQKNGKIEEYIIHTKNLDEEILPENIIEIKKQSFSFSNLNFNFKSSIKDKELKLVFYELSLMLESNILFDEALDILIKSQKNMLIKEFLQTLQNTFFNSIDVLTSLKQFKMNPLVKSFFKITQDSGNIVQNIKALSILISEEYEIKKEFTKSMIYPFILFFTFFFSLLGIFKFVVPKFEFIFSKNSLELSYATKSLLFVKYVFENYLIGISVITVLTVLALTYLYKNNDKISYKVDKILFENLFLISTLYRLKNLYRYFTVVSLLLDSKYEINETISRAKVLIENKYLLDRITKIENLLKSGKSIHLAFTQVNMFDDITLSLIRTGEITNSLETTIKEIKNIHKKRFDEKLEIFSQMIEPIFFIIIMSLIIWIILAIFVPLWSMGDMLKV